MYKYVYIYIYMYMHVIMETMCPPAYHHHGFVATHALGHMIAHELPQSHCGDNREGTLFS